MNNFKPRKTSFLSGVKLEEAQSNPLVNNTLHMKLAGCIIYLTHTQPYIYYEVSLDSIQMYKTHDIHWMETKIILNFVQGTKAHGIHYVAQSSP